MPNDTKMFLLGDICQLLQEKKYIMAKEKLVYNKKTIGFVIFSSWLSQIEKLINEN